MKRLAATLSIDVRTQYRNGFYAATLVVVIASIALLRWLPLETAGVLLPAVIIGNVVINAFYFVSALLLLERVEDTLLAQRVTPLRTDEYLIGKLVTLTTLSVVESMIIGLAVFGPATWLIGMAFGIVLAAALFCLVGISVVLRYDSINEFLLPSVPVAFLLCLPLLSVFGVGGDAWYLPHPIRGPLALMQVDAERTASSMAYAIGYPVLWIVAAYIWSRRALTLARAV